MNILIKSAKIIDNSSPYHQKIMDILIENGKFSKIDAKIKNLKGYKEISLENLHVSTGWFDTSVSLGEPGYEERENLKNGLIVAAKSGFTAIALNPNTNPKIDNKSAVEFLINKSRSSAVSLYPIANLTQDAQSAEIAELFDMFNSGAIAFGDYNSSINNANLMKLALLYAQNFKGLILSFPQDMSITNHSSANEGKISTRLGLKGNPSLAEELQIVRDLFLLEYTGGKLHIPTISTANSVKLIEKAKRIGLNVSCSVSAHHLYLTEEEIENFNTNCKVSPPLRTKNDIRALKHGIKNGTIDMITSDHNPIDIEHKKVEFENALDGTIGLESLFGAIHHILSLDQIIPLLTTNPRKKFGLNMPTIKLENKVDITLFNPDLEYIFKEEHILSNSKNSAFLNKSLKGKAYGIFADNKLIIN
jgi:dihydroorotase